MRALQPLLSSQWSSRNLSPLCPSLLVLRSLPGPGAPEVASWVPSKQPGEATSLGLLAVTHLRAWCTVSPVATRAHCWLAYNKNQQNDPLRSTPPFYTSEVKLQISRKVSREMLVFWPDLSSLRLLMQLCIPMGIGYLSASLFARQWLFRLHAQNRSCKSSLMSSVGERAILANQKYF